MGEPTNYNPKEFIYRVGTFFLLVGVGLLIFFMLSEAAEEPQFNFFCWSMVLLTVGFMFRAQYRRAVVSSGRFSILKRLFGRGSSSGDGGRSKKTAKKEEEYDDDEYEYEDE